ncbi:MAG: 2Fe-2S iron-sulfur cluster-binding protein [Panacagrimonas sp.]
MPKITFVEHNGTEHPVEADETLSLMEVATSNLIPGIDADCGGACACGTCHVHIAEPWLSKLSPMTDGEKQMLEVATAGDHTSRLSCQIRVSAALEGMVVRTPVGQH